MATIEFQCPECGASLQVPEEVIGSDVECPACHETFETVSAEEAEIDGVEAGAPAPEADAPPAPRRGKKKPKRIIKRQPEPEPQPETAASGAVAPAAAPARYSEYKVIKVNDTFFNAIVLGMAYVPTDRIHQAIAEEVKRGWQLVFQVMEERRFLCLFRRRSLIITFGR